jgi:cytochrome c oxidase cbb3-type subunit 3
MTGNKDQWSERVSKGKDTLYSSAINGIGVMPAKGGISTLSDDEVKSAVDYLISEIN